VYSVLAGLIVMAALPQCWGQPETPPPAADRAQSEELKKEADLNLYRLKRSIEKDGFFSARIALNIWRSTSLDAGAFDPKLYDQLKIQLYEKSMTDSLSCYQYFIQKKDLNNAKTCMLIWRSHAREIDRYDPAVYQKLQEGLEDLTKK
jgi:hypothetical protein